jgi:hypothetical protein
VLKDIRNNDKEVWGKGVALSETVTAPNPVTGHPIEKRRYVAGGKDARHPVAPSIVKIPYSKDDEKAFLVDRFEGFLEIDSRHQRGGFSKVASPDDINHVDNVFGDSAS